jgi:antirestriction protein ArdC
MGEAKRRRYTGIVVEGPICAGCVFRDNLAEHVALNEDKTADVGCETLRIPILRTFSVFHASQVDGIAALDVTPTRRRRSATRRPGPSYAIQPSDCRRLA